MKCPIVIFITLLLFFSCNSQVTESGRSWTATDRELLIKELTRTRDEVLNEINELNDHQWSFRESEDRWSIAEIIEHQGIQDELFYRELSLFSQYPIIPELDSLTTTDDQSLLDYANITSQNTGKAPWYLEPQGRWCSREEGIEAFLRVMNQMIRFVQDTDKDLRKYYTPGGRGSAPLRDLHQLLLVTIAHTDRHLKQLKRVKKHPGYPN